MCFFAFVYIFFLVKYLLICFASSIKLRCFCIIRIIKVFYIVSYYAFLNSFQIFFFPLAFDSLIMMLFKCNFVCVFIVFRLLWASLIYGFFKNQFWKMFGHFLLENFFFHFLSPILELQMCIRKNFTHIPHIPNSQCSFPLSSIVVVFDGLVFFFTNPSHCVSPNHFIQSVFFLKCVIQIFWWCSPFFPVFLHIFLNFFNHSF